MPGTQEITRRIKSVKSTRKITKALQMISAAKMRKTQSKALASRAYSQLAAKIISHISNSGSALHPLFKLDEHAKKVAVIVISTNKGFVGGFNSNLLQILRKSELTPDLEDTEVIVMGRKAREGVNRLGKKIVADFEKNEKSTDMTDIYPISRLISENFVKGRYKAVYLLYNKFVSTLSQKAELIQLLPFAVVDEDKKDDSKYHDEFIFEPDPKEILDELVPRVLDTKIYQAVLESDASEHAARMLMMKNATDAAGELIGDLTLTFNQLRQNKITTELSEITAGKLALEN